MTVDDQRRVNVRQTTKTYTFVYMVIKPLFSRKLWSVTNFILAAFILLVGVRQLQETTKFQEWLRKEQSRSPNLILRVSDIDTILPNMLRLHFSIANKGDAVARNVQARLVVDTLLALDYENTDPHFKVSARVEGRWKIFKFAVYAYQEIIYTQSTSPYGYDLLLPAMIDLRMPENTTKEIWLAYHIDSDRAHFYDSLMIYNPFVEITR